MTDKAMVLLGASLVVGFIVWWFFGARKVNKQEAILADDGAQEAEVVVDGGYLPNVVVLRQGVPAIVVFNRKDTSSCFSEIVLPDFGVHEQLPVGKRHAVKIDTSKAGEFQYSCGMNMFHGKIFIK